jgi:hypothetical protein
MRAHVDGGCLSEKTCMPSWPDRRGQEAGRESDAETNLVLAPRAFRFPTSRSARRCSASAERLGIGQRLRFR